MEFIRNLIGAIGGSKGKNKETSPIPTDTPDVPKAKLDNFSKGNKKLTQTRESAPADSIDVQKDANITTPKTTEIPAVKLAETPIQLAETPIAEVDGMPNEQHQPEAPAIKPEEQTEKN